MHPPPTAGPPTTYAAATDRLAARIAHAHALAGAGGAGRLRVLLRDSADSRIALGAVRLLGADVLAPEAMERTAADAQTADLIGRAYALFPGRPDDALWTDSDTFAVTAWRDWAAARLLARHGWDLLPHPQPATLPADGLSWQPWSARMAQLAPLALPGLDSPVHRAAAARRTDLARGATRAVLRRDHATAAALGRWLAVLPAEPGPDRREFDPAPLLDHLRLFGDVGARAGLDVRIGLRLLDLVRR
ncbi:hypothetical protein OG871_34810 [Kitasatospora sp. NBC_00374]|uniref:hypothetical protein n=1 Tax=Kitasatospora sp. NBC_00374 TaxID=2975964 RepID=UPI0032547FDE